MLVLFFNAEKYALSTQTQRARSSFIVFFWACPPPLAAVGLSAASAAPPERGRGWFRSYPSRSGQPQRPQFKRFLQRWGRCPNATCLGSVAGTLPATLLLQGFSFSWACTLYLGGGSAPRPSILQIALGQRPQRLKFNAMRASPYACPQKLTSSAAECGEFSPLRSRPYRAKNPTNRGRILPLFLPSVRALHADKFLDGN